MRVICNEYRIGKEKLIIEHDPMKNNYYFKVIDIKTSKLRYESEPIAHIIPARAKGFEFMGIKSS